VNRSYEVSKLLEEGIDEFIKETRKTPFDLPDLRFTPLNGLRRVSELQVMDEVLFAFTEKNKNEDHAVKEFEQIVNRGTQTTQFENQVVEHCLFSRLCRGYQIKEGSTSIPNLL
jgi:hypothetical protein